MVSAEKLQEWETLCKQATDGPWYAYETRDYTEIYKDKAVPQLSTPLALVGSKHKDAIFIAAARTAMPQLIATVHKLKKVVSELLDRGTRDTLFSFKVESQRNWLAKQVVCERCLYLRPNIDCKTECDTDKLDREIERLLDAAEARCK